MAFENVEVRGGLQIRSVGLVGSSQFNGIEIWSVDPPVKRILKSSARAASGGSPAASRPEAAGDGSRIESWPLAWARGSGSGWSAAPNLVDGDTNTLWIGSAVDSSWSIALDFEETIPLQSLDILDEGEPWPVVGVMGTDDLLEWYDLGQATNRPVACRAIFIYFHGDGSGSVPAIREIQWETKPPW
jgi:hypothetical protein